MNALLFYGLYVIGFLVAAVKLSRYFACGSTQPTGPDAVFGAILALVWPVFFIASIVRTLSRIAARIETRITAFDITDPDKLKEYRR